MEEKIKRECERVGINPDVLTEAEKKELAAEITAKENGKKFFDGVLDRQEIRSRM